MKSFNKMDLKELFKVLNSSKKGLRDEDVLRLQKEYGKNEIPQEKPKSILKILAEELKEPIVLILLVTIIISFFTQEYVDALAIIFIVIIDLLMGLIEQLKAQKNAQSLQKMLKNEALVRRHNQEFLIDSSELVMGDIVLLSSGNKVPADMRLIESFNLSVDESMLTGESLAIYKDAEVSLDEENNLKNMVYAGTSIVKGRALGIVVATGINTELGKIAKVVEETKESASPLEIRMNKFTKQVSIIIILISLFLSFVLVVKGTPLKEIFLVVVALGVSAMPEGLPLAKTMALTIGSNRMLKKRVLVKNLNAVEALGSCTVIASDKTGTLTKNEQTAKIIVLPDASKYPITGSGYNALGNIKKLNQEVSNLIKEGIINNEAHIEKENVGDSIDLAFLYLGQKANIKIDDNIKIINKIPYESENKYSAAFYEENHNLKVAVKGSLETILNLSTKMLVKGKLAKIDKKSLIKLNDELALDGYRVIALATKDLKKSSYTEKDLNNLVLTGLVGFIDPIREESKDAIKTCQEAGIKVMMITGDYHLTSYKIAKDLKLVKSPKEVALKEEMDKFADKTSEEFYEYIKDKKVFSRVSPLEKYAIVDSLIRHQEFVAVTGDGVNDAPALKKANIGISMGSGTDVAKDTAQMILLDDNFLSIVEGVKEGRNAYQNIRKICYLLLSCGFAEVFFFILAIIFDLPMPLLAIQLLWLNIVTDGIQDIALSFEEATNEVMKEKPRQKEESIFNKDMLKEIFISSFYISFLVLILWLILIKVVKMDVFKARGYVMCLMVFIQNVHVLNCRSEKESILKYKNKNWFVPLAIISCLILQFIVMEIPFLSTILKTTSIPLLDLIVLFLISLTIIILMEVYKKINYK